MRGMDKKELNLNKVDVGWKDLYKEHPVRFVIAAIIWVLWILEVLGMHVVNFDVVGFLISTCIAMFFMWLAYGPINYHRVKRHKEMVVTADYILKNQNNTRENEEPQYCTQCGGKIDGSWSHCPKCGNKIK